MPEQTAHEVVSELAELGIAVLVIEQGLAVLLEEHMHMHAVAGFAVDGLGHKGCGAAFRDGGIADDVLCDHGIICHLCNICQLNFNLKLTGAADLVMMVFDLYSPILHEKAHLAAEIIVPVLGRSDMITALVGNLETVAADAGIPVGFLGVDFAANGIGLGFKIDIVEYMEFEFRPDYHFIGNTGSLHIINGCLDDVAGVLIEGLILGACDYHGVAAHGDGLDIRKGIDRSGAEVGDEDHIAVFYGRIAVVGTVKTDTVF